MRFIPRNALPVVLAACMAPSIALAQESSSSATTTADPAQPAQPTQPTQKTLREVRSDVRVEPGSNGEQVRRRPPLLREGSALVRVVGTMTYNEAAGDWRFVIDPADPRYPEHELRVMPSAMLREMERLRDAVDDDRLVMEITGQVYIYNGWNYLLPTHPPLLISRDEAAARLRANQEEVGMDDGDPDRDGEPGAASPPREQGPAASPQDSSQPGPPGSAEGDSTADILRALERATGPVIRRPEPDDRPTASVGPDVVADARRLLAEGSMIVDRLGTLRRTRTGGWMFVFDADAEGLDDPPAVLLPCMVLERLEGYAERQGRDVKVLLSGQVTTYRGRNFVLPTMFRRPRLSTPLTP